MTTDYKASIRLPQTNLPMRADLPKQEPKWLALWQQLDIYESLKQQRKGQKPFIYHDGPPYANGPIHTGHAVGKILRDGIVRMRAMAGDDVRFKPGWDCHGLPIEWKVEEKYRAAKQNKDDVPVVQFRAECRDFAQHWVNVQSAQFQKLGVNADWKNPYLTMSNAAEAAIYRELTHFVKDGSLYRGLRPVMWSVVEKTALAEAEAEYHDKTSTAIFVRFPIVSSPQLLSLITVDAVIWTTTAWTLPGNRAIAFAADIDYVVLQVDAVAESATAKVGDQLLIAAARMAETCTAAGITAHSIKLTLKGSQLKGVVAEHPLKDLGYTFAVPLHAAEFVTTDAGTGLVHIAPSHGEDDFNLNRDQNLGLEVPDTVTADGRYTHHVPHFEGQHVFEVEGNILSALIARGKLLAKHKITHSYPHSWRSKAPLIFRATPQWFISLEKNGLRQKALKAIDETQWLPASSINRIRNMVAERGDWCISRQRTWGVPIAIFVHKKTGEILRDETVLNRIIDIFKQEGADAWYASEPQRFLGDTYKADDYEAVRDVVDVWFESGCTHAFVVADDPDQQWPADLYLEGNDQHRGWFQSSLLEACGTRGRAPYKTVITHGFILDSKGEKMSKSLGNVISAVDAVEKFGADILRLWAFSVDWTGDINFGFSILEQTTENYRRFRNTFRYMLGNLNDFSLAQRVDVADMPALEQYILARVAELESLRQRCVEQYNFLTFYNELYLFCHQDLSAFYFDIRKDALYCDAPTDLRRRACQTVLYHLLHILTRWLAPVLAFTTEEVWHHIPTHLKSAEPSVHLLLNPDIPANWTNAPRLAQWQAIRNYRRVLTAALEEQRAAKKIGSSLEASLTVYAIDEAAKTLADVNLAELTITSSAIIKNSPPPSAAFQLDDIAGVGVVVSLASGQKCARCWMVLDDVGSNATHPTLCARCADVVERAPVTPTSTAA